jgi:hypothetical protein
VRWSPECYGFWAAAPRGEICPRRSSGRGKRSTLATVNGAEKVSGSALWRYSTHDKCESVAVGLDPVPKSVGDAVRADFPDGWLERYKENWDILGTDEPILPTS